jgi:integrase
MADELRKRTTSGRHTDGVLKRCGCPRRAWAKCSHPWHLAYQWRGTRYRVSLDRERGQPIRSKTKADEYAETIRLAIRGGTFHAGVPVFGLTFGAVLTAYDDKHVHAPGRRESAQRAMGWHVGLLRRAPVPAGNGATMALGDKPISAITKADVEAVRDWRRREHQAMVEARRVWEAERDAAVQRELKTRTEAQRGWRSVVGEEKAAELVGREKPRLAPGSKGGEVGINRLLGVLRHVFSWAIAEGYCDETPFKRHGVTVVKLAMQMETERTRRLEPGEEDALLAHAGPRLRGLIVAALSTGCRLGELLTLTWGQVRRDEKGEARQLVLPAAKTKTNRNRVIPIGARLRAELEMRRQDPNGKDYPATAAVFGEVTGEPIASITKAWDVACRRAGVVGLHFHDLRREFGCRLIESGAGLHDAREFLGHANISTTSRYLRASSLSLEKAITRLDQAQAGKNATNVPQTARTGSEGSPVPVANVLN